MGGYQKVAKTDNTVLHWFKQEMTSQPVGPLAGAIRWQAIATKSSCWLSGQHTLPVAPEPAAAAAVAAVVAEAGTAAAAGRLASHVHCAQTAVHASCLQDNASMSTESM